MHVKEEAASLCQKIQAILIKRGRTLSTAESCTGGRLSAAITAVPGASDYYKGSIVAYDTSIKEQILGVKHTTVLAHDVVSEEVVREMTKGACKLFATDYAIATSGYAGPYGNNGIPAGTIWIAFGKADDIRTLRLTEDNGRENNVCNAAIAALEGLYDYLTKDAT